MIKIKVTEEEKVEILKQINRELESYIYTEDYEPQRIETEIDLLKNENIVSQTLIMMFYLNISIKISPETKETIKEDFHDEPEVFDNITRGDSIKWTHLQDIYSGYNILKNRQIILDPEIAEILILFEKTVYKSWNDEIKQRREKIVEDIKSGKISFYDLNFLIDLNNSEFRTQNDAFHNLILDYNQGKITEDELLVRLGSKGANIPLLKFKEKYQKNQRNVLKESIIEIFDSYQTLVTLEEQLPQELKNQIDLLFLSIDIDNIDNLDINSLEDFVHQYNEIANKVWQEYLDGKNNFLIHATTSAIKGEFRDSLMSTSLISLPDLTKSFSNRKVGYIINPKHIQRANSNDLYTINLIQDEYSSIGTSNTIFIKLPQVVKHESLENDAISEIVLDDFEIDSVIYLSHELPKRFPVNELEYLERQSQAQGGIPIKMLSSEGLITIENAQMLNILEYIEGKRSNLIQKQVELAQKSLRLGIEPSRTDYSQLHMAAKKLSTLIKQFDSEKYSEDELEAILEHFTNTSMIDKIFSKCENIADKKFDEAFGKKIQSLITQAEKIRLQCEYDLVEGEKVGFIPGLMGAKKLKRQILVNIKLRDKLISFENTDVPKTIADLYSYVIKNGKTIEILEFLDSYVEIMNVNEQEQAMIDEIKQQPFVNERMKAIPLNGRTKADISKSLDAITAENQSLSKQISAQKSTIFEERIAYNHPMSEFQSFVNAGQRLMKKQEGQEIDIEQLIEQE